VAAAAVSILAAVVVFAIVTVALVDHQLRSSLDAALRERAQEVAQLAVSAPGVLSNPGALESPISGRQISVEVLDAHERIVARSLNLGAELLPEGALARAAVVDGRTGAETIELNGRPMRLYAAPIADAGGPASGGAVLVASDTSDIARTTSRLGELVALSGAAVVLVAVLAAALLTRRSLRPLRSLADAAAEIERTADASRRLPDPGAPDEIGQLTGVLNRMLGALEEARAGERRFLADASHELRTPTSSTRPATAPMPRSWPTSARMPSAWRGSSTRCWPWNGRVPPRRPARPWRSTSWSPRSSRSTDQDESNWSAPTR
jgi:two-component system OmpR family sensor kinase